MQPKIFTLTLPPTRIAMAGGESSLRNDFLGVNGDLRWLRFLSLDCILEMFRFLENWK